MGAGSFLIYSQGMNSWTCFPGSLWTGSNVSACFSINSDHARWWLQVPHELHWLWYKYLVNCIECGTKFGMSKPVTSKHGASVTSALLPLFYQLDLPEILQSGNGRKFTSQASDSRTIALDNKVRQNCSFNYFCFVQT